MFKVKHFMDTVEADDGLRVWVEACGLTRDLRKWCEVHAVAPHFGPPRDLAAWYDAHDARDAYEYFRYRYHEHLAHCAHLSTLREVARHATMQNVTLLHQGDDPSCNTAAALHEFLSELSAYCPPFD